MLVKFVFQIDGERKYYAIKNKHIEFVPDRKGADT